jgi:hypothetical protein
MARNEGRELRGKLREEMIVGFLAGGTRPSKIADQVIKNCGDLVSRLGDSLARSALVHMARQELRKAEANGRAARTQLELPIELQELPIPAIISVPFEPSGIDPSEVDDTEQDDHTIWLPWRQATLAQALGHLNLLNDGITRDIARRNAWKEFCDYWLKRSGGDLDAVLGDLLDEVQLETQP